MPEAAIHKHRNGLTHENEVRATWEGLAVEAKAETGSVDCPPNLEFGRGVLGVDASHDFAAGHGSPKNH
jgi:hypothetical protein